MTLEMANARTLKAIGDRPKSPQRGLGAKLIIFVLTVVALSGIGVTAAGGVIGNFRVASFSLTAIVGFVTFAALWLVVLIQRRVPEEAGRVFTAFGAFVLAASGSALVGTFTRQGIQYLQVLAAAIGAVLVGAIVSAERGKSLDDVVAKCIRFISVIIVLAFVASAVGAPAEISPRTTSIVALIGIGWFLAEYRTGHRHAMWWALALLVGVALSLSRSSLVAGALLVVGVLLLGSPSARLRSIIVGVLVVSVGIWAITSWAPLHSRFFSGDLSLSIGGVKVNTEGRTQVWDTLWKQVPHALVLGHGPGAASALSITIDPAFDQPHNDYLRLIYDFGLVGSLILVWLGILIAHFLRHAVRGGAPSVAPMAASYSCLGILIVMVTDNPLDYPFVMIPLGALVGLGIGRRAETEFPTSPLLPSWGPVRASETVVPQPPRDSAETAGHRTDHGPTKSTDAHMVRARGVRLWKRIRVPHRQHRKRRPPVPGPRVTSLRGRRFEIRALYRRPPHGEAGASVMRWVLKTRPSGVGVPAQSRISP